LTPLPAHRESCRHFRLDNADLVIDGPPAEAAGVSGLLFHDLRRTAARNLRRAGIAEGVIMKIGGWRTRSVFERYAIVSQTDISDALEKLQSYDANKGKQSK
jgi:integrase